MSILRVKEIRRLEGKDLDKRVNDFRLELSKERAQIAIGASTSSPGRIREIRRTIARIHTIQKEASKAKAARPATKGPATTSPPKSAGPAKNTGQSITSAAGKPSPAGTKGGSRKG
ncbi:MAG: 50S ribosomal protein L29 [Candidatus Aenigmarchaeota archaeon]|nr:50S ribosomal protein L29 [Candidatus Aenigmarchaeota archaeon]